MLVSLPAPFLHLKQSRSARGRLRHLRAELSRQGKGLVKRDPQSDGSIQMYTGFCLQHQVQKQRISKLKSMKLGGNVISAIAALLRKMAEVNSMCFERSQLAVTITSIAAKLLCNMTHKHLLLCSMSDIHLPREY